MRLTRRLADALRSPRRFAAFFRRAIEIAQSGELPSVLRRLRGHAMSDAEYRTWQAAQASPVARGGAVPFLVALDPIDDLARQAFLSSGLQWPREARTVLIRRARGVWTPLGAQGGRPLAEWLDETGARWIWWLGRPARLEPGAVHAIAQACEYPEARLVYTDHDVSDAHGRPSRPHFKCAWDVEQIIEHDYAGPLLVTHASLASHIEAAGGPAGPWPVLLRAVVDMPETAIVHVPRVLQHLPDEGTDAARLQSARHAIASTLREIAARQGDAIDMEPSRSPWLRYAPPPGTTLSVVIPTRDRVRLLERCIRSVMTSTSGIDTEIVIVDNGSTDERLAVLLREIGDRIAVRVVPMPQPFNFAKLCNAGVASAGGRVVMLLNNDAKLRGASGVKELVGLAARHRTGAVGPLLVYPDGRIQSAGVLVGVNRIATSALAGCVADRAPADGWRVARRRVTAVMGACLVVERDKYLAAGGMDERFAVSHNEVDLCLRLEACGWSNVFTPFATVEHEEGATRGFEVTREEREQLAREERAFRTRWREVLGEVDPAYHPALARVGVPFSLGRPDGTPPLPRAGWRPGGAAAPRVPAQQPESAPSEMGTEGSSPRSIPSGS